LRGDWPLSHGDWPLSRGDWPLLRGDWPLLRGDWPSSAAHSALTEGVLPRFRVLPDRPWRKTLLNRCFSHLSFDGLVAKRKLMTVYPTNDAAFPAADARIVGRAP
jgi:hypothetical protein